MWILNHSALGKKLVSFDEGASVYNEFDDSKIIKWRNG